MKPPNQTYISEDLYRHCALEPLLCLMQETSSIMTLDVEGFSSNEAGFTCKYHFHHPSQRKLPLGT